MRSLTRHKHDINADSFGYDTSVMLDNNININDSQDTNSNKKPLFFLSILISLPFLLFFAWQGTILSSNYQFTSKKTKNGTAVGEQVNVTISSRAIKELQIKRYISGDALLLNIHITHHAGTTFCGKIGNLGPRPKFACMRGDNWPQNVTKKKSWSNKETATMVQQIRPYFHMVSWEFQKCGNLHDTNWEYENLVSVIVMRHPLDRLLSRNTCDNTFNKADRDNITAGVWWNYASSKCADNYALKVLSKRETNCCQGANTSVDILNDAKDLIRRFTFVIDMACMDESLIELTRVLSLPLPELKYHKKQLEKHAANTFTARERIGNDTLYEYLMSRFRRDIELYEWSRLISIVDCSHLNFNKNSVDEGA